MLTLEQKQLRKLAVGSSDVAAILGVSSRRSAYGVWLEKTGRLPDNERDKPWLRVGSRLEKGILDEFEESVGALRRSVLVERPELHLACNVDAIVDATGEPVEAKTAGLFGPLSAEWGEPGGDGVPREYVVQAHAHMIVCERDVCHLPALIGGKGFIDFRVERSERLAAAIVEAVALFWTSHVVADEPPPQGKALVDADVLRLTRRTPERVALIPAAFRGELQAASAARKEADERYEQSVAAIRMADADAEAFDFGDDAQWLTDFEQSRTSVDGKALKAAHPDIYEQFARTLRSRVLRIAKRPAAGKAAGKEFSHG